jgi:hypothetical protein
MYLLSEECHEENIKRLLTFEQLGRFGMAPKLAGCGLSNAILPADHSNLSCRGEGTC